eukprot:600091-Pyramimonas_sp.AAC.1
MLYSFLCVDWCAYLLPNVQGPLLEAQRLVVLALHAEELGHGVQALRHLQARGAEQLGAQVEAGLEQRQRLRVLALAAQHLRQLRHHRRAQLLPRSRGGTRRRRGKSIRVVIKTRSFRPLLQFIYP